MVLGNSFRVCCQNSRGRVSSTGWDGSVGDCNGKFYQQRVYRIGGMYVCLLWAIFVVLEPGAYVADLQAVRNPSPILHYVARVSGAHRICARHARNFLS